MQIFRKLIGLVSCILISLALPAAADLPSQWHPTGIGGGGALFAPSFSPHNASELYVSCDVAGLFRSTNLGTTWDITDFREIVGNRRSIVQYTNDPNILYAIDYTSIDGGDTRQASKSIDAGLTWTPLLPDPPGFDVYSVNADPANSNRLLVSTYSDLYFSANGGTSVSLKFSDTTGNGLHVAGAFFDGANIYVGTNNGLLVSSNNGSSFALSAVGGIPASQAMVSFAGAKQGGITRFFAVTIDASDVFPDYLVESVYSSFQGIYRLTAGDPNWILKTSNIPSDHDPHFVALAADNISTVYVAGQSTGEFPIIYKSTNAGDSWSSILLTDMNQNIYTGWAGHQGDRGWTYGAGALGFTVARNDINKLAFTDLGFAHYSADGGATWHQMYVPPAFENPVNAATPKGKSYPSNSLEVTAVWYLTWADANNIFASYTDIQGTRSTDAGQTWSFNYSGHNQNTMYHAIRHPSSGILYAGTSTIHDIYQSTYLTDARIDTGSGGRVLFSSNQGATWQILHEFNDPVIWIAADPNNANRLYASVINNTAGTGGIYVSSNINNGGSSTWTKLADPPRTQRHPFNIHVLNDGTLVATYSARRAGNPLTFTASSGIFVSTNNGSSWIDRTDSRMQYWTKDLIVDPHDPSQNTWYATVFHNWGLGAPFDEGGVYKTTDRGVSWVEITETLTTSSGVLNPESVTISPVNPNEMYMTTELDGLWYTSDLNSPTPVFTQVSSYPFYHSERVFFNPFNSDEVWVTSYGNGIRVGNASDTDRDGIANAADCNPADPSVWSIPTVARSLMAAGQSLTTISWTGPLNIGGTSVVYDVLRSASASDFSAAVCVAANTTALSINDGAIPSSAWYYLVRAENICGGSLSPAYNAMACP